MIQYTEQKITPADFNFLTDQVGWGTRDMALVEEALQNTLYSVCAYEGDQLIGYGRLIGDKTIFLYVQDIMVLPSHQGKGVGTGIMNHIMGRIRELKSESLSLRVYLGASKGREAFYENFGFITRSKADLGEGMLFF